MLDCSREAAHDADFLLTANHLRDWESKHGSIPRRAWVLMRTDWSKRHDPVEYQNYDETGQHTPGPDVDAVKFLVAERDILGFGTESIGTDAGQAYHLRPPYPCHYYMHGAGRYGLQCLTNLDQLPPTGAVVIAAPLKIRNGSGSPLRVLALSMTEKFKIWFQGATDKVHMAPYIAKVEAHLKSILEPQFEATFHTTTPPATTTHAITEFRIARNLIRNAVEAEKQGYERWPSRISRTRAWRK